MIRILCVDISSADTSAYERLYALATPERKQRADRYMRQEDKLRCVTAEALLRYALGTGDYRVLRNDDGKPYIADREDFFFNLSHSGRYVVIACGAAEVGVDVQRHKPAVDRDAMARRFFAADEQVYVRDNLPRFYEIWTKKESYLKYTGTGLRKGLNSFSVLAPETGVRYQHRFLEGGYSLSLCTTDGDHSFEQLQPEQLLY